MVASLPEGSICHTVRIENDIRRFTMKDQNKTYSTLLNLVKKIKPNQSGGLVRVTSVDNRFDPKAPQDGDIPWHYGLYISSISQIFRFLTNNKVYICYIDQLTMDINNTEIQLHNKGILYDSTKLYNLDSK